MLSSSSCPSCGAAAEDSSARFCSKCGAHLGGLWAAGPAPSVAPPTPSVPPPMPPSIPLARRRSPWVFVAAAVSGALVLAVVVLALIFTTGNTTEIAAAGPTTDLLADRALKRCVDLWNSEENATARMQFTVLGNWGDVYASVTHSTDYPDKCLISAAAPAADMALQSIETGNDERDALHMPFSLADQVSPNGLADLVGGWNATIDDDGLVALN